MVQRRCRNKKDATAPLIADDVHGFPRPITDFAVTLEGYCQYVTTSTG